MEEYLKVVDEHALSLDELADAIWDHPETAFTEFTSSKLLEEYLEKEGFEVTTNVANIPTAFMAKYGSGKPVIGFLGEFDALSGLSQKAGIAKEEALEKNGNGHGCGHNLLGVGAIGAALVLKDYLEKTKKSGTVIYYGCPGEEGGSGKAFMARSGIFNELDCALTWHPSETTEVAQGSSLANIQVLYKFTGTASHAAANPEKGRSALDALELMNVGTNFLREHMPTDARVHYSIIDGGGYSPNVVQPHASVLYLIRSPKSEDAEELYRRVNLIAEGMAMATETHVTHELIKTCAEVIPNIPLEKALYDSFLEVEAPKLTTEELEFMKEITATSSSKKGESLLKYESKLLSKEDKAKVHARLLDDFYGEPLPYEEFTFTKGSAGSTDVGDVSWNTPTAQIHTATWAPNSGGHSWQIVSQGKGTVAHKYMRYASKVLGLTAIHLLEDPSILDKAKKAWLEELNGRTYRKIPDDVQPRSISSLAK